MTKTLYKYKTNPDLHEDRMELNSDGEYKEVAIDVIEEAHRVEIEETIEENSVQEFALDFHEKNAATGFSFDSVTKIIDKVKKAVKFFLNYPSRNDTFLKPLVKSQKKKKRKTIKFNP